MSGAETPLPLARKAAAVLEERGVENALLEAELLLAWVLGIERLDLYLQFDRSMREDELEAYRDAVRRRRRGEPLQYITGEVQFRELTLGVDRRVLIPRPETEVLVGTVLRWAFERAGLEPRRGGRGRAPGPEESERTLVGLDVGTGSGAIALSLAAEGPFRTVVATDVSADALEVARANARRAGLEDRVELRHGSLWEAVGAGERFDVVVSNPPYIGTVERESLSTEVRDWEPAQALFAGERGYDVIEPLVQGAADRLHPGGLLALEVGYTQAVEVAGRIAATGRFADPRVVQDLAGRDRIVLATTQPLS